MIDDPIFPETVGFTGTVVEEKPSGFSKLVDGPVDALLLSAEWGFRQIYWRSEILRGWIKRVRAGKRSRIQVADRQELIDHLYSIGVNPDSLVMVHSAVSGLSLDPQATTNSGVGNSLQVAKELVSLLLGLVDESGTLVMPTHPVFKDRRNQSSGTDQTELPVYNPMTTPCGVGLANEIFWRQPGTQRSLFPHNTLAARGPLAAELLHDNLNDSKPLPHGVDSGYYRFCRRNGLLVSIGVPLASCFTLVHAAEEARDENWTVGNFFEERSYILRNNGEDKKVTIRKTRAEFMMFSLCIRKLRRDLVRAGILHEGHVGTVRVDWANSGEIFRFITERNRSSTYPYFGTSFVTIKARSHVARS